MFMLYCVTSSMVLEFHDGMQPAIGDAVEHVVFNIRHRSQSYVYKEINDISTTHTYYL